MSERQRFHPLALAIFLFEGFRNWLFFFIVILFNGGVNHWYGWLGIAAIILWVVISSLLKYFTQSYAITPEKIMIFKGILRKSETDIPYERIQTVKQRQWFFFQPFHVIQVLIETAGGDSDKAEASLPAVNESVLATIEHYRQNDERLSANSTETAETAGIFKGVPEAAVAEAETVPKSGNFIYRVTNGQIFLFGLTDLSIFAAAATVLAFANEIIPEDWIDKAASTSELLLKAGWIIAVALAFLAVIVLAAVSILKNFLQYYNFRVSRQKDTLTIESGLLERKIQKIPLDKIQGIKIHQQIIRRVLKISSVELILAGGQEQEGESSAISKLYFLPIVKDDVLFEALDFLLPEWDFDQPEIIHTSRKRLWYFWRWPLLIMVPIAIGGFFITKWITGIALVVGVLWLAISFLDSHFQGYMIQGKNRICVQSFRGFTKLQTFVERNKIQAYAEKTSIWLFKKQIGHATMWVKAGTLPETIELRFADQKHVTAIKNFYRQSLK